MQAFKIKGGILVLAAIHVAFCTQTATAQSKQGHETAPTNKRDCLAGKMQWDDKAGNDGKGACVSSSKATNSPTDTRAPAKVPTRQK